MTVVVPTGVRVVEIDRRADTRWETFLASHPAATVYHHPRWLAALEREYGRASTVLGCEDAAGNLRGVLPLMSTRGTPFNLGGYVTRRRISSLPRTPIAGPLAVDRVALGALVGTAAQYATAGRPTLLELKVGSTDLDGLVDGLVRRRWRTTYVTELTGDPATLRFGDARNHAAIKRAVQKAARLGVTVRPADTRTDLRRWYQLYLDTMRYNLVPPRPYRWFTALWELLRPAGLLTLLVAERHTPARPPQMIAGSIVLSFGTSAHYAFNGRDRAYLDLRPNDAIHWRAIHDACAAGRTAYDLGEVAEHNAGLAQYKRKWGAPRQLYRYYLPAVEAPSRSDNAGNEQFARLVQAAWRRVPLRMTRLVGDAVYAVL